MRIPFTQHGRIPREKERMKKRSRSEREDNSPYPARKRPKSYFPPNQDDSSDGELEIDTSQDILPSQLLTQDEEGALFKSETITGEAEVGVIDKVTLINFMCHKKLDISLSPNVNFILGRNGSGKSAIMTGIVVALGGNARNTERGKSLKQFIRSGERTSEIRVHLRNRGVEAYRPEVYGDTIIVERAISNDGTGSYKIKSSSGKLISNKKDELINVLDHCGIQVDNPVSLLNQDTSRHFLQKSKPGDKYKLFMKATHLEQIASDYERAEEDQKIMKEGINRQSALLPEYESEAKKLEEKVETFRRLSDLEEKVEQLEKELQWALVIEIKKGIIPIEGSITKEKARIPRNTKKLKETKKEMASLEEEGGKLNDELSAVVVEASSLQDSRDGFATQKRGIDKSLREHASKIKDVCRQIKEKENEKECLERARENCLVMSQRDTAGEKKKRLQEIEHLQETLDMLKREIATAENDRTQLDAEVNRSSGKEAENRRRIAGFHDSVKASEDNLARLKSSYDDGLAVFGRNMGTLIKNIHQSSRQFSCIPIGPIGSLIKLKDYAWATAVEQLARKSFLYSFIADSQVDAAVLRKIINSIYRQGPRPEVIVSPYQDTVYNVSRNHPQCQYPTVLDMLNVDDPNVLNVLIDQLSVESVLLIKDRVEANRVVVHQRPKGVKAAYTIEGDQILQYAHYSNKQGKFGILRESVQAAVKDEEMRLAGLKLSLNDLQREGMEVRKAADKNKQFAHEIAAKIKRKMRDKRELVLKIGELQNAQEEEEPEEDIATYDSEIAEMEDAIKNLIGVDKDLKMKEGQLLKDRQECYQKHERCEKEVEQISAGMVQLKAEFRDSNRKKHEAELRIKYYEDRITSIQDGISVLEAKVAEQKDRAEAAARAAEEVCPMIKTDRSHKSIKNEIEKIMRLVNQELPQRAEQEEIEAKYVEAMERYEATSLAIKNEKKSLIELRKSLRFRKDKYCDLQERIASRAQIFFTYFLRQRDFDGMIRFNHEKERLEITVKVDCHTGESKSTRNTKALSGGERSFTTVCFIMSLWEAMEAPFRCLDEFDVFMDMMNRRISMRLMLEHAEDQPNRQFIFFTPQDMSSMDISCKKMKVLRLDAPERGQTTLNLRGSDT